MPITAFYAALLTPVLLFLSARTVAGRSTYKVMFGDGGQNDLLQRIRRHGNFVEYTPFALILLGLAESLQTLPLILHACGVALAVGRIVHAVSMTPPGGVLRLRVIGMALTMVSLGVLGLACLYGSLMQML